MKPSYTSMPPGGVSDGKSVANLMLEWAEQDGLEISNLKLQKLLFFCHADLLKSENIHLISDTFEAWDHGPVLPSVYREFKASGRGPIKTKAKKFDPVNACEIIAVAKLDEKTTQLLRTLFDRYKRVGAFTLSGLSHSEGGPWDRARELFDEGLNPDRQIKSNLILRYYRRIHG